MPLVNKPTVAVWMVTYNHEAYIAEAISSVMGQVTDFEVQLFIGEDCSTDGTRAICKTFADQYPDRITLLENSHNLGPRANAFQVYEACLASGAPYIALLEGDDYWIDNLKLKRQVNFLNKNLNYTLVAENGKVINSIYKTEYLFNKETEEIDYSFFDLIEKRKFPTSSTLFRANLLNEILSYDDISDTILWCYLALKGKVRFLPYKSSVYRKSIYGIVSNTKPLEWARQTEKWNKVIKDIYKSYQFDSDKLNKVIVKKDFEEYLKAYMKYGFKKHPFEKIYCFAKCFFMNPIYFFTKFYLLIIWL